MTWPTRRGNKYGAVKQTYQGFSYDSKAEALYAMELTQRQKNKEIKRWERQKTLALKVYGKTVCTYRMDFVIFHNDKSIEYVEIKGFSSATWRLKYKLYEAIYEKEHPKI